MSQAQVVDFDYLDRVCSECKQAIEDEQDPVTKQVMRDVCEKCRKVRASITELEELRKSIHEMDEKYSG